MSLDEIDNFTLVFEKGGVMQKVAFSRSRDGWACVITDKGGEYERTFDFPEEVLCYIGERALMCDKVVNTAH